jgi:hypothetical protein
MILVPPLLSRFPTVRQWYFVFMVSLAPLVTN